MKINLTSSDLQPKPKSASRLPGEKHTFIERSIRNLVPPQHLQGGAITSSRDHEVGSIDPLMRRAYMSPLIRTITIFPAYDKRSTKHGVHGADMRFTLGNEAGYVSWVLFTNWQLPQIRPNNTIEKYPWEFWRSPTPADFDYHSPIPQHTDQTAYPCDLLPGKECYSDGTACTKELFELLIAGGTEALWAELESRWHATFNQAKEISQL